MFNPKVSLDKAKAYSNYKVNEETLYLKLGGEKVLGLVIEAFYRKILSDTRVSSFFKKADMSRVKKNHLKYLCFMCGGPDNYRAEDLQSIHKNLKIQDSHFDAAEEHMKAALAECGVSQELCEEILKNFDMARPSVLGSQSLYDRLGGQVAIDAVVDIFYRNMLRNPKVEPFFRGKNVDAIKRKQKLFQAEILGSKRKFEGRDIFNAHKGLNIKDEDFDEAKNCLEAALVEAGVARGLLVEVLVIFERYRQDCVLLGKKKKILNKCLKN